MRRFIDSIGNDSNHPLYSNQQDDGEGTTTSSRRKQDTSDGDIRKAFRSLARKFHPDKNPDDSDAEKIQRSTGGLCHSQIQRRKKVRYVRPQWAGIPFGPGGFQGVNISLDDLFGGGFDGIFNNSWIIKESQPEVTILSIVGPLPSSNGRF